MTKLPFITTKYRYFHSHSECGSLGLAIDNTGSGSAYLQIVLDLVDGLEKVPSWTLTTFDCCRVDSQVVSTNNVDILKASMVEINFSGSGGSLRATQGDIDLIK